MLFVDELAKRPLLPLTIDLFRSTTAISQRYQISYRDAAIIVAAKAIVCDGLYTEDLNSGQDYAGVLVINPFSST